MENVAYTSRFYQLVGWLEKILKRKCLKRKAVSPLQVSGVNAAILSTDQACTGVVDSQAGSVYNNNQNTPCKRVKKCNDLESRSMRENLLFHGFDESNGEECEQVIKDFIANKLEIDTIITLDRTHRLGRPKTTGPIPIVAKFNEYKQRELVRTTSITKSAALRADHQSVDIQQTKAILQ